MPNTQLEALGRVVRLLDGCGISYCVGGSLASSYHGVSRTTADADIVVDLRPEQLSAMANALEAEFYVSRDAMREALREKRSFNAIHLETLFKVDFFVLGDAPFDREEFHRRAPRQLAELPDVHVSLMTAEGIVLSKLRWFRSGGEVSDHQWRDILGVLVASGSRLDLAYMERWAARLGVSDLLSRASAEASTH